MKTKDFIEKVEALGYVVDKIDTHLVIEEHGEITLALVSSWERFAMTTDFHEFKTHLSDQEAEKLAGLIFAYAATPIEDREEEKRYYLRFIHPNILGEREPFYLHLHHSESAKDYYEIGTVKALFGNKLQTIFTEAEIAEMDITGFEKIEVSND